VDNAFAVGRAFDNAYWPALYFGDAEGRLRHHHFGEEDYERSERVIQRCSPRPEAPSPSAHGASYVIRSSCSRSKVMEA
jgi:hypothetical protein